MIQMYKQYTNQEYDLYLLLYHLMAILFICNIYIYPLSGYKLLYFVLQNHELQQAHLLLEGENIYHRGNHISS